MAPATVTVKQLGLVALLVLLGCAVAVAQTTPAPRTPPVSISMFEGRTATPRPLVGAALDPVAEGSLCPFKNIMRCATPFFQPGVRKSEYDINADGFPNAVSTASYARSYLQRGVRGEYTAGDYVLLWEGSGTMTLAGDVPLTTFSDTTHATRRITFTVATPTDSGITFIINTTSATARIRNVRIGLLADEAAITDSTARTGSAVFNAAWIALASEFDVLFLPHWQREYKNTYEYTVPEWTARPQLTDGSQATDRGVSHDFSVILADAARVDLWIAVPWNCTRSYMDSLAAFYAQSAAFAQNASKKLYVTDGTHILYIRDPSDRINRHKQIYAAFSAAFGARMSSQVEIVLDCSVCAGYIDALNPLSNAYDAEFRRAVAAIASPQAAVAGAVPWQETQPNPYYFRLRPYLSDIARIAREELWEQEARFFDFNSITAYLGLKSYAYTGGVEMGIGDHFGFRYRHPNTTQAEIETQLLSNLHAFELSNDERLGDLTAEWAERYYRAGGRLFIAGKMLSHGIECRFADTRLEGMNRNQCGYHGLAHFLHNASAYSKLRGLRRWRSGNTTYADELLRNDPVPAPQACSPTCVWGDCIDGRCECYSGYTGADCSTFDERKLANRCSPSDYGIGLAGLPDWTTAWAWTDMTAYSRNWVFQPVAQPSTDAWGWIWNYEAQHGRTFPALDSNGYPRRLNVNDAVSTFQRRDSFQYPHGLYHLFYDGDGIVTTGMDGHVHRRVRPGHMIIEIKPVRQLNNGLWYKIIRTNPDDPVRNVRIVHASMLNRYQNQPFHPLFVRSLQEYRHVRFMNNMLNVEGNYTNGSLTHQWAERPTPRYFSQAAKGMAIEYVVRLANMLHVKPWINVPFHATDDYVRNLALAVKRDLNPRLFPVTVEYSNEVWATHHNIGFHAADAAIAAGIADGSDSVRARSCWVQYRSRQIWRIFQQQNVSVFRVLGGQSVQTRVLQLALECQPNVAAEVDALIIAPYLGESLVGPTALRTTDEVFLSAQGVLNDTMRHVENHAALARQYGLTVGTYEAGPAYFGGARAEDPDIIDRGFEIHRDARMQQLIATYFSGLFAAGSTSINAYFVGPAARWGRYGAWGMREYQNQDPATSYKYLGYRNYAATRATCDASASVDTSVLNPSGCPSNCNNRGWCMRDGTCECYWGYNGTSCENAFWLPDTTYCNRYTCADKGGTCQPASSDGVWRKYQCSNCTAGWGGWHCHIPMCDQRNNCSWNGRCTGPQTCTCYRGFQGADCATDCGCNAHGSCNADGTCTCDQGYRFVGGSCVPTCDGPTCLAPGVSGCAARCVYGYCWNGTCNCWDGYSGATCSDRTAASRPQNFDSAMGINLAGISDWASSIPFVNFMWRSRDWIVRQANELEPSSRWSLNEEIPLTEEGYPASLPPDRVASTFTMRDTGTVIRGGRYHVYYDGEGDLEFGFDAREVEGSHSKGYVLVDYTPTEVRDNGFFITIRRTNPANPIRNIRVLPPWAPHPAFFSVMPFTEEFLSDVRPFSSVRFYNWVKLQRTYRGASHPNRTWATRKRLHAASMATGYGVNEDLMIHLCNLIACDPWFTIPHDADEDYVMRFATLIKRRLRPDVRVNVEHSNEVWNYAFESHKFAVHQGRRIFGSGLSVDQAAMRWHGFRSERIFRIFRSVFGAAQRDRLKFHLGSWTISPRHTELAAAEISIRPVTVAVTTYFCGEETFGGSASAQVLTSAQLAARCRSAVGEDARYFQAQRAAAARLGLEPSLSAYEGGPSLVQYSAMMGGYPRPGVFELYSGMHRHESMRETVQAYFANYTAEGVSQIMYFTSAAKYSIYGSWGIKESTRQACNDSPKCRGTLEWVAANRNATARRPTWGMFEYGVNNVVRVQFDRVPTTSELETSARNIEQRLQLPVFSVTAVVEESTAANAARRQSGNSGGNAVLFIVTETAGTDGVASNAQRVAEALSAVPPADLGLSGYAISGAAVETTSDVIQPGDPLPPSVTNAPPAGGYTPPPALGAVGGSNNATPAPSQSSSAAAVTTLAPRRGAEGYFSAAVRCDVVLIAVALALASLV